MEAQQVAQSMTESHRAELAALRTGSAVKIQELDRAQNAEKQMIQQELASMQATAEAELHSAAIGHARGLEEMQANHDATEAQMVEEHAAQLKQVRAAHSRSIEAVESASAAASADHAAAVSVLTNDLEQARMDVAQVRGELQEARTKCASELAEMKAAHAAAAADIAEAAAAHQYMDVAEIKKSMQSERKVMKS